VDFNEVKLADCIKKKSPALPLSLRKVELPVTAKLPVI
jgi:hypothetical protein